MKVRATRLGYYNNKRQREGAEFFLKSDKDFSKTWMEKLKKSSKAAVVESEPEEEVSTVSDQEVI